MNLNLLIKLLECHSTPGDEGEVIELLNSEWQNSGLNVSQHGPYAISARFTEHAADKPTVLVCAHMDSPGYIIDSIDNDRKSIVKLGSPEFSGKSQKAIVKTKNGKFPVTIQAKITEHSLRELYYFDSNAAAEFGDRVCYESTPTLTDDGLILSPFLDNRIGCFVLGILAENEIYKNDFPVNLVLAATSYEEIGSRGATVLAQTIKPDLAICLDATYENKAQNVLIGGGPVLTLSDASVILSCQVRDEINDLFEKHNVPLQTEVYNYSGTDAKAFPLVGLKCLVLPLLIASIGNHSPEEKASIGDIETLIKGVEILVDDFSNRLEE